MRILDHESKRSLKSVLIMLTTAEAKELVDKVRSLDPTIGDHCHIDDADYQREITLAIYTADNLRYFSAEVRSLIDTE